jgi:hypothetical protein
MQRVVFLVPGFFGFTSLGSLNYFYRVSSTLAAALDERGVEARIVECRTKPTGSIRNRAVELLREVVQKGGLEADELHFVGHSTGGLDVRLLLTPGVRLVPSGEEERIGRLTRTATLISTPHFGTPLAAFFTTLQGRHLLKVLTLLALTRGGRYTLFAGAQVLSLAARLDDFTGRRDTFLDVAAQRLLRDLTPGREDPVWSFVKEVSTDQGVILQLTPEGMHLYNAAVVDRPDVRYGCVVTAAPPPPRGYGTSDLRPAIRPVMASVFAFLHTLNRRENRVYGYPSPAADLDEQLGRLLPFTPDASSNDGIVPAYSQLYGELVDAVSADHLDVVGQFRNSGGQSMKDWLPSGSNFDEARFRRVWRNVAGVIGRHVSSAV